MCQSDCVMDRITFNPSQCGGRPCIRGMRIRVSFEEYAASQNGDPAAVRERFAKRDKDSDGFVTRDEFIGRTK